MSPTAPPRRCPPGRLQAGPSPTRATPAGGTTGIWRRGAPGRGYYEIWSMGAHGEGNHRVLRDPGRFDLSPSWTPDGRRIVFSRCDLPFGFVTRCGAGWGGAGVLGGWAWWGGGVWGGEGGGGGGAPARSSTATTSTCGRSS